MGESGTEYLFLHQNYLSRGGYRPEWLASAIRVIDKLWQSKGLTARQGDLVITSSFVLDRFSFMVYSLDKIKDAQGEGAASSFFENLASVKYYFLNFIFSAKSLIDNAGYYFKQGYSLLIKNEFDITLGGMLLKELAKQNRKVSNKIYNHSDWIEEVRKWRNPLYHKNTPYIIPLDKYGKFITYSNVKNFAKSFKYYGVPEDKKFSVRDYIKKRHKSPHFKRKRIEDFCLDWLQEAESIAAVLFEDLTDQIERALKEIPATGAKK